MQTRKSFPFTAYKPDNTTYTLTPGPSRPARRCRCSGRGTSLRRPRKPPTRCPDPRAPCRQHTAQILTNESILWLFFPSFSWERCHNILFHIIPGWQLMRRENFISGKKIFRLLEGRFFQRMIVEKNTVPVWTPVGWRNFDGSATLPVQLVDPGVHLGLAPVQLLPDVLEPELLRQTARFIFMNFYDASYCKRPEVYYLLFGKLLSAWNKQKLRGIVPHCFVYKLAQSFFRQKRRKLYPGPLPLILFLFVQNIPAT